MRVSRLTPIVTTRPFNKIFESYGDVVMKFLQERKDADPGTTYVEMPETQKELIDFALSGSQDVGLLVGDIGIGKSSVITFLREKVWPNHKCLLLFKDFSEKSENINFPRGFYELPVKAQRQRALSLANAKITELIRKRIGPWLRKHIPQNPVAFLQFLEQYFPGDVPDELILTHDDPLVVLNALQDFQRRRKSRFLSTAFFYYVHCNDVHHVKFVIDNLDDKEIMLLHALIELAAHFARGFRAFNAHERTANPSAPERWMTIIAACRPSTAELIMSGDKRQGNRWHGYREVVIDEPVSLAEALKLRYQHQIKGKTFLGEQDRKLRFTISQVPWTISNRDRFFEGLCEAFNSAGQARQILDLCNNNLAEALGCVLEVVRNRHFIRAEDLLKSVLPDSPHEFLSIAKQAFTRTSAIRALAYGNQGDVSPVYPIRSTPVVNILDSRFLPFGKSTFKLRIIAMLAKLSTATGRKNASATTHSLCHLGREYFGINEKVASDVIDELHDQGVIGNTRLLGPPSTVAGECSLHLRPRGALLWRLLAESTILLQCYYDDCELDTTISWDGVPAGFLDRPMQEFRIEEIGMQVVWMARQLYLCERREIDAIHERGAYQEFCRLFGDEPLTLRVVLGMEQSDKHYFQHYTGPDLEAFHGAVQDLRRRIEQDVDRWQR